jgi:segregation and condensation protein A
MSQEAAPTLSRNPLVPIDCRVQIPDFDGPLDLLLHLIRNHELNLLELPIAGITKQYLIYLDYMREINLDLASEYLVMAATLTYLKSQIILPQELNPEATGPDPRAALIRRLVELKCYKEIAASLAARPRLNRDVFTCRNSGAEEISNSLEPEVEMTNPFQLTTAYNTLINRRKGVVHQVVTDEVPLSSCVAQIVDQLQKIERVSFLELLPEVAMPQHVISMFLAVLELTKLQLTTLSQDETFGPLFVSRKGEVEELESAQAAISGLTWN